MAISSRSKRNDQKSSEQVPAYRNRSHVAEAPSAHASGMHVMEGYGGERIGGSAARTGTSGGSSSGGGKHVRTASTVPSQVQEAVETQTGDLASFHGDLYTIRYAERCPANSQAAACVAPDDSDATQKLPAVGAPVTRSESSDADKAISSLDEDPMLDDPFAFGLHVNEIGTRASDGFVYGSGHVERNVKPVFADTANLDGLEDAEIDDSFLDYLLEPMGEPAPGPDASAEDVPTEGKLPMEGDMLAVKASRSPETATARSVSRPSPAEGGVRGMTSGSGAGNVGRASGERVGNVSRRSDAADAGSSSKKARASRKRSSAKGSAAVDGDRVAKASRNPGAAKVRVDSGFDGSSSPDEDGVPAVRSAAAGKGAVAVGRTVSGDEPIFEALRFAQDLFDSESERIQAEDGGSSSGSQARASREKTDAGDSASMGRGRKVGDGSPAFRRKRSAESGAAAGSRSDVRDGRTEGSKVMARAGTGDMATGHGKLDSAEGLADVSVVGNPGTADPSPRADTSPDKPGVSDSHAVAGVPREDADAAPADASRTRVVSELDSEAMLADAGDPAVADAASDAQQDAIEAAASSYVNRKKKSRRQKRKEEERQALIEANRKPLLETFDSVTSRSGRKATAKASGKTMAAADAVASVAAVGPVPDAKADAGDFSRDGKASKEQKRAMRSSMKVVRGSAAPQTDDGQKHGVETAPKLVSYPGGAGKSDDKARKAAEKTSRKAARNATERQAKRAARNDRLKVAAIVALVVVVAGGILYPPARQYYISVRTLDEAEAELAELKEENQELKASIEDLGTDDGIENYVREQYGWVDSGEQAVSVTGLTVDASGSSTTSTDGSDEDGDGDSPLVKFLDAIFMVE